MRVPVPAPSLLQPFETPAVCSLPRVDGRGLDKSQRRAYVHLQDRRPRPRGTQQDPAGTRRARPGAGRWHKPRRDRRPLASPAGG